MPYDAINTLADCVQSELATPGAGCDVLLQPLLVKWTQLTDDDEQLIPLLGGMTQIALALDVEFMPPARRCANGASGSST